MKRVCCGLVAGLGVLLVLVASGPQSGAQEALKRWNFLLVVIDTLRYDATSLGGTADTPFLQLVARRGVTYGRAHSTHDDTPRSHFSLLTGFRDGLMSTTIDRPDVGLPYQLGQAGYATFGVSANGALSESTMATIRGFRTYACLLDEWNALDPTDRVPVQRDIDARLKKYGSRPNEFNRGNLFSSGSRVLEHLSAMLGSVKEPFFGFVNILEPHDPYLPSETSLAPSKFDPEVDPDLRFRPLRFPLVHPDEATPLSLRESILARLKDASGRNWSLADDLSEDQLKVYRRRYQGEVRDADLVLRRIILTLEKRNLLDNTWVIITSDHGEAFGEAGFVGHWLSDAGDQEATRHVPLVWSGPLRFQTGSTIADEVSLMDVAPTVYDMAGVDWHAIAAISPDVPYGRSLVHQLTATRPGRGAVPRFSGELPASMQESLRKEALDRLRALGYIK